MTCFRLTEMVKRFDEERKVYEDRVWYGGTIYFERNCLVEIRKVEVNSYMQEQYSGQMVGFMGKLEGFGCKLQPTYQPEEILGVLEEQKQEVVALTMFYCRMY